jgi:DNA-binding beta-propeller fold protein YncE
MRRCGGGLGPLALAAASLALAAAPPAQGSPPLAGFPFSGTGAGEAAPPGGFEGPCGAAVDSQGDFYLADYYRDDVDVFAPSRAYLAQLKGADPLQGPCGLAVAPSGALYVEGYHGAVVRFAPAGFPVGSKTAWASATAIDPGPATGLAVDPASGDLYVDDRTYVAVYEPSGAPLESGGQPLRIGLGSLEDGYGVAVSSAAPTAGYVYVPDAATNTVQVYDPAAEVEDPVAVIDGHETPPGRFVSLRDAALAVDDSTGADAGYLYVADDLQPEYFERPEAAIYGFAPSGAYAGRLPYNVIDALPPGLAVDGSTAASKGRVYVTSGNSEGASVYAYGPGSLGGAEMKATASAPGPGAAGAAASVAPGPAPGAAGAGAAGTGAAGAIAGASEVAQRGSLRVALSGGLAPSALPRAGVAPVAVRLGGRVFTTDGSQPPQLRSIRIELNRHGRLEDRGLPACPPAEIRIASSARALAACRSSLVGTGSFGADVILPGQAPYPTGGRLLLFNASQGGHPELLGQIYAAKPFATSFLIRFQIAHRAHGAYGTVLSASLPAALGSWGHLSAIELRLSRHYSFRGRRRSYLSAGCPAPAGFPGAIFNLARASFAFAGGATLSSTLTRSCRVRG